MAKPRRLAFRVPPGGALGRCDSLRQRDFAAQMTQEFGQPDRLHRRQARIETAGGECRRLCEHAGLDHSAKTDVAGGIEPVPRGCEQKLDKAIRRRRVGPALPCRKWHARRADDLVGPHEALPVARKETPSALWVEQRQPLAERGAAETSMKLDRLSADLFGDLRDWRQPLLERVDVEAGAADQNRQPPGRGDGGDLVQRQRPPVGDGTALGGVEKTVEPMRRALLGSTVGTRRQDAEIAIDLQAVGVDDGPAERVRQLERKRRFATRGRTGDDQDGRLLVRICARRLVASMPSGVGGRSMRMVLTLIAGVAGRSSLPRIASGIAEALGSVGQPVWLAPEEACDLVLEGANPAQAEEKARALIKGAAIDVLVQPAAGRRKQLLAADLEATIIENEMLDEIAKPLGLSAQVSETTRRAMNGEIDFTAALEARVALFKGLEARVLQEAAARIRLTPGAHALVATMRRAGAATALVSGGFAVFAEPVAAALGFDRVMANRLDLAQGRITGTVQPPIVTGETKRQALLDLAAEFGITPARTIAVGDGANDLTMLAAAGIGIAFRPKPVVAKIARWRLDHADLTGVLYAQGYRKDEIAG
jgi:phosphoserine phosphatase